VFMHVCLVFDFITLSKSDGFPDVCSLHPPGQFRVYILGFRVNGRITFDLGRLLIMELCLYVLLHCILRFRHTQIVDIQCLSICVPEECRKVRVRFQRV